MTGRAADFSFFDAAGPIGLAHRGGEVPATQGLENSRAAFAAAVAMGYRYLETDVHATKDGVLVAFHDDRLDRVTNSHGLIRDLPYEAVASARIGGREPIPLMSELLDAFPRVRFNIDVKAPEAIGPLVTLLRERDAVGRVCIASFSPRRLQLVRRALGPGVATASSQVGVAALRLRPRWLAAALRGRITTSAPVLQVPQQYTVAGRLANVVTPHLVKQVHALGKHLHVWTVNEREAMDRLFDLGVDGIISDRIEVLASALADRGVPLHRD